MHPEIINAENRLNHLFKQAHLLQQNPDIDDELKAQFVWYLCVRTTGYIESSVKSILNDYVESTTTDAGVIRFISEQLERTTGLRFSEIRGLLGKFNLEWSKNLDATTEDSTRHSLGNLVRNRNEIAHGRDVSLTLLGLETYYEDAKAIVKFVYDECHPDSSTVHSIL